MGKDRARDNLSLLALRLRFVHGSFTFVLYSRHMKKSFFVKLPKEATTESFRIMVNVCAWCPKEDYPQLKELEEYTHGLCDKHYHMLKSKHQTY